MKTTLLIISLLPLITSCSPKMTSNVSTSRGDSYEKEHREEQYTDEQITARIKTALWNDNALPASGRLINVETKDGVVTLSGDVFSKEESAALERKVKTISGVRKVNNQLTLNQRRKP